MLIKKRFNIDDTNKQVSQVEKSKQKSFNFTISMASNQDELNANEPLDGESGSSAAGGNENSGEHCFQDLVISETNRNFCFVN